MSLKKHIVMTILKTIIIMITTLQQINTEAIDHIQVKIMREYLEDLIQEAEVRNLNISSKHFSIKDFKGEPIKEIETNIEIAIGNSLPRISRPQAEGELVCDSVSNKRKPLW